MRDDDCYREAMIATTCPIIWIATARYNIIRLALGTIPLDTRDHTDLHSDEKDTGALYAATIHILRFPIATRIPTNIANLTIYVLILTYSDAVDSESSARCTVPLNTRSIESMSYYLVGATSLLQALPS